MRYFTSDINRSERAKQVAILVPALMNKNIRFELLNSLGCDKIESDTAEVFHFVWVLRDQFYAEREELKDESEWSGFINRWVEVLNFKNKESAKGKKIWIDFIKSKNSEGIIHPCNRQLGWTEKTLSQKGIQKSLIEELIEKREIMNTESDCFVQTSKRLIIIECKDKTGLSNNQLSRQEKLISILENLFPRENKTEYIIVSNTKGWTWEFLKTKLKKTLHNKVS